MLGSPKSDSPFGASIGKQNETLLKIKDDADSESALISSSRLSLVTYVFHKLCVQSCIRSEHLFMVFEETLANLFCM